MASQENTHLRDLLPLLNQRKLGRQLYMTDLDSLHFTYKNNQIVFSAIIDYKNSNVYEITDKPAAIKAQKHLANILNIPFFICITFLDPIIHIIPMYYLIPVNSIAKSCVPKHKWFSENDYSLLQHDLRYIEQEPNLNLSTTYKEYPITDNIDLMGE